MNNPAPLPPHAPHTRTPPKALLLDLDGTLVDSRRDLAAACNAALRSLNMDTLSVERIASYVGNGLPALLARVFPDADQTLLSHATTYFGDYYRQHCCDDTQLYPHMQTVLQDIHARGCQLAVVSNKPVAFCQAILDGCHISSLMSCVIGGDTDKKPSPQQLFRACRALGVSPADVWMIGDHDTDLKAAAAADIRSAWCSWGIGHHHGSAYTHRLDTPSDILQLFDGLHERT